MNLLHHFLAFSLSLFIVYSAPAQSQAANENHESYKLLAGEILSLPIPLISDSGRAYFLLNSRREGVRFSAGPIVDDKGAPVQLPGRLSINPIEGRLGNYLVEHFESGRPVVRIFSVQESRLVVGDAVASPYAPGSLMPLPDGSVASFAGANGGPVSVIFNAFQVSGDKIVSEGSGIRRTIGGSLIRLGSVNDPISGQVGEAMLDVGSRHVATLVFPSQKDVRIEFEDGVYIFAAGGDALIVGFYTKQCAPTVGLPDGICTPFIFKVPVPNSDTTINAAQLSKYLELSSSRAGWTFGALHKITEPSDFRIVGNRLYTISYAGMTQSLGYVSLDDPNDAGTVIAPESGTDLSFQLPYGTNAHDAFFVERKHAVEPTKLLMVTPAGEVTTAYEAPVTPTRNSIDLGFRTFQSRPEALLSPMIIVGPRANIDNDVCKGGLALVEIYGGHRTTVPPSNPIGLIPSLFSKGGIHAIVSIPGSGGYGILWSELGTYSNAPNQIFSLAQTLKVLRKNGCQKIVLLGFSHGGIVSLNTALSYPDLVDAVVIGGAPLNLKAEFLSKNPSVAAFLPQGADYFEPSSTALPPTDDIWAKVSPAHLAKAVANLEGLTITIMVGDRDGQSSSYTDPDTISDLRRKGARVEVVFRNGVGHTKYSNVSEWAEYHAIIAEAIAAVSGGK